MTEPVAAALIALDEADEATLTEIARATDRSVSTVERAMTGLAAAGAVTRVSARGFGHRGPQRRGPPLLHPAPREQAEEGALDADERTLARKDLEEVRVWLSGLQAVRDKLGVRAV